jgi:tRNA threonylcarbamoyladenosine biosynthesis protein TsaB
VELALDTASDLAGLALTDAGALVSELTWRTRQNHSKELLPALEWLLGRAGATRSDLGAVFVCTGPGSYAGLRVGVSTAKALAYGLGIPVAGVGRLAAEADHAACGEGRRVVPVHAAGRAELAFAVYSRSRGEIVEVEAPRLGKADALLALVQPGDLVCGEMSEGLRDELSTRGAEWAPARPGRVWSVARLGLTRLAAGDVDSADSLVPLYLREPAIGPQPQA